MDFAKSGGFAGLIVDVVLFPIDTIKTRLQSERGFRRSGGFRGIYNGLAPAALGSVPTAALFFCTYESMKNILYHHSSFKKQHAPIVHMTSATIAEMMACLIRVPVEIAKQRRQTLNGRWSHSAIRILIEAYKADGLIKGLYRGYSTTIFREIPFSFIQFPIWEFLKANWVKMTGLPVTSFSVAICGAISGGCAAAITTPLDVAKTRVMLAEKQNVKKLNTYSTLYSIYMENGVKSLFAGFVPRVAFITLGGFIFFGSYHLACSFFNVKQNNQTAT